MLAEFSHEFISGMSEKSRARRLGDVGANAPSRWTWGRKGKTMPHVMVMLYGEMDSFATQESELKDALAGSGLKLLYALDTHDIGDVEPFGFNDGVSQPEIDWDRKKPPRLVETRNYTNVAALGEFLLGYRNEYGLYTDRPLVDAEDDPERTLPLAEDRPGQRDFGKNGTFLVVRDLEQDVPGFWRFLYQQSGRDSGKARKLAAALVGRNMNGDPIVRMHPWPIPGVGHDLDDVWGNQFTFAQDPDGLACPFGAHIRRANPRNADLPPRARGFWRWLWRTLGFGSRSPREDLAASTRFHRLLRRGREYGPQLLQQSALASAKQNARDKRGLRFICLNANILRQFEFVQSAWLESSIFDGLSEEGDPLVGSRALLLADRRTDNFSIPRENGLRRRITGLPQFVTVRGGAYFFLPGIRALRYIAKIGGK
jgi:deferrochelatase/peroxidase EfeB